MGNSKSTIPEVDSDHPFFSPIVHGFPMPTPMPAPTEEPFDPLKEVQELVDILKLGGVGGRATLG